MELTPREDDRLATYLAPFLELAGDRRTARLLAGTLRGIVARPSLVCSRIAALSPGPGCGPA